MCVCVFCVVFDIRHRCYFLIVGLHPSPPLRLTVIDIVSYYIYCDFVLAPAHHRTTTSPARLRQMVSDSHVLNRVHHDFLVTNYFVDFARFRVLH